MLANNEVGTIEPVRELAAIARAHGAPFHTDAVQAVGHIPVDVRRLDVDALSLSWPQFHGPRGIGALYLREGFSIPPLTPGGAQERGERAGTENLAGIVGMGNGARGSVRAPRGRHDTHFHLARRARRPAHEARRRHPPHRRAHHRGPRRPPSFNCIFTCNDVDGELLVVLLDRAGVAAATGSACSTGSTEPSHVLTAMRHRCHDGTRHPAPFPRKQRHRRRHRPAQRTHSHLHPQGAPHQLHAVTGCPSIAVPHPSTHSYHQAPKLLPADPTAS
ncbi:MAG: cysteine desulfurase family protein [Collinsella sp.]